MTCIAQRYQCAIAIAHEAGKLALRRWPTRADLEVDTKGPLDWVSDADRDAEHLIRARIGVLFENDKIIGEEHVIPEFDRDDTVWVVDPIDGTTGYLGGLSQWCVSIGIIEKGRPVVGVVYDPVRDEIFTAMKGYGAMVNGEPIATTGAVSFGEGQFAIGWSPGQDLAHVLGIIERLADQGGLFVRLGSAALTLAQVAAGRLLGYYEPQLAIWDCIAGSVLVSEAGGWVSDFIPADGPIPIRGSILASGSGLAESSRDLIASA